MHLWFKKRLFENKWFEDKWFENKLFNNTVWLNSLLVVGVSGWMAGCSSSEDRVLNEDHQYVNAVEGKAMAIPQGLEKPQINSDYELPTTALNGAVGEQLDVRSPVQLLALASGSRLDDNNRTSMLWFDQTEVVKDLSKFTWDAIKGYLKGLNADGSTFDEQEKTVITDWIHHVDESSFWSWGASDVKTSYRYKMTLQMKPHGKTGAVTTTLIGHQLNGQDVAVSSIAPIDKIQAEVGFLNEFVYHFQILQELRMDKTERTGSTVITLDTTQNDEGQQAFHSSKGLDTVWAEFRVLLEGVGIKVDDVDRGLRKLFISYKAQKPGFWDSLWGDEAFPELDLPDGEYMVRVKEGKKRGESLITLYDKDDQPLPASQYLALESVLIETAKTLGLEL